MRKFENLASKKQDHELEQAQQQATLFSIKNIFKRDYENYEGVRKINIYVMSLFFVLMFVFIATNSWRVIITPEMSFSVIKEQDKLSYKHSTFATVMVFMMKNRDRLCIAGSFVVKGSSVLRIKFCGKKPAIANLQKVIRNPCRFD